MLMPSKSETSPKPVPVKADVVVIGGGPAGTTATNLLAQKGYEVVLLDKVRHPRLVVGESVLPHVWKYIDLAGAREDIEAEVARRKKKSSAPGAGAKLVPHDFMRRRIAEHMAHSMRTAPHVTALLARLLSCHSTLSPVQAKAMLHQLASPWA